MARSANNQPPASSLPNQSIPPEWPLTPDERFLYGIPPQANFNNLMTPNSVDNTAFPYPSEFYDQNYGLPPEGDWGSPSELNSPAPVGLWDGSQIASNDPTMSYAAAVKAFQNASASSAQNIPAVTFAHDWQSNNLDPVTAQALLKVDQALAGTVPGLTVTSAYRPADYNAQVGGAQSSQHISGKAIDLDLSSFTPAQRQAVLQAVMAQPEIKGIGVYDKNLNTLHFDTRAGDRVAWGPDYTTKSLGSVLNGFTQPMLTGWLNGSTPSALVQSASVTPPLPNLRSTALAFQGANPYDTAPLPRLSPAAQAASQLAQGGGGNPAPQLPPALTQTAASWLPPSLQQGGQGFVDNLGGGMSPLHQVTMLGHGTKDGFAPSENTAIPPGPYGADALLRAAQSGDPAAVRAAMDALTKSAQQAGIMMALPPLLGGKGLGAEGAQAAITKQLTDYLNSLPATAPGALRAVQTALQTNPGLRSILDPAQLKGLDATFAQLPPLPTGSVPFPNLRPPMPQQAPTAPLVAGPTPDPLAPKMASFAPPPPSAGNFGTGLDPTKLGTLQSVITAGGADSWMPGVARYLERNVASQGSQGAQPSSLPFAPGDNLDVRTDGEGNASPIAYQPPAPDAAGLAQLLARGGQQSGPQALSPADMTAMQGPAGMPSPSAADAGLDASPRQYWTPPSPGPDFGGAFWNPSSAMAAPQFPQPPQPPSSLFAPPPLPSPASLNPTQMRGLEGPGTQGKINYAPLMAPGMPNFALPGGINYAPLLPPGQPFFGTPQSMTPKPTLRPPMASPTAMQPPMPRPRQVNIGAVPPMPQPAPMSPQQAFQAMYGPAPQNVNWQATLAPDPFSQAAPGTYVLNDYGSRGPPQNDLQEAASQQGDSYLNYPDFSFGF